MSKPTLILIPCCYKKKKGGGLEYDIRNCIINDLGPESGKKLLELRRKVAIAFEEKHGPDLGFEVNEFEIEYLEAWQRYTGNLYSQIHENSWEKLKRIPQLRLLIVSALYGLVNFNEPIRYYNRTMKDRIHSNRRLNTWWKRHGLRDIILDYIMRNGIEVVHNFLSTDYSEAIANLASTLRGLRIEHVSHTYRGFGSGSNYYRGREINALIQGF